MKIHDISELAKKAQWLGNYCLLKAFVQKGRISVFWPIFIFCMIELIDSADWIVLTWKTSFCDWFCWFALCFWEVPYAKKLSFPISIFWRSFVERKTKETFCFAKQWSHKIAICIFLNKKYLIIKYFLLRKMQIAISLWHVRETRLMYHCGKKNSIKRQRQFLQLQNSFEKKSQEYFTYCQDQS